MKRRPLWGRMKRGGLIGTPVAAVLVLLWKLYAYITSIKWIKDIPGPEATDFIIGTIGIVILLSFVVIVADVLIDIVPFDRPFLKLLANTIPLFNIPRKVKEDKRGEVFKEVVYDDGGLFRKGVLMSDTPQTIKIFGKEMKLYPVWEPRPLSPGGRIGYIEAGKFDFTGRSGLETFKEISTGYGIH